MIKKTTKLYLLALLSILLMSACVSNSDEPPVVVPEPTYDLTYENLQGIWEVYFFEKYILKQGTSFSVKYRYTEIDGFKVGFGKVGGSASQDSFYEMNPFGTKTTVGGKYLIGNYDKDNVEKIWEVGPAAGQPANGLFFDYKKYKKDGSGLKDTMTHARLDNLFVDHFAYRDITFGSAQGNKYRLTDIRYYRNTEKAPNYNPGTDEFKKEKIEVADLLGRWEFYNYIVRAGETILETPENIKSKFGEHLLFRMEGKKQACYEFSKDDYVKEANRAGEFKIVDDVVHIFLNGKDSEGKPKTEAFKLWIKKKEKEFIREYDIYRHIENVEREIEDTGFYKRVGDS